MEYLRTRMQLKDLLAIKLRVLMDARPDLDTQMKLHKRTGLSQSTIGRVLSRQVHTGLDVVEAMAKAFNVSVLDLLKPLEGADCTRLTPTYDELDMLALWRKMSAEDQHRAMAFISVSTQTAPRKTPQARQINVDSVQPVPANLSAAVKRASKRMPESYSEISLKESKGEKHNDAKTKGRKGRTA